MRTRIGSQVPAIGALLAYALGAATAMAQGDPAAARTLFDDGRKLAAQGKYEQACPKFEESQKLDPGTGTLFNLADCWEHLGRTASAWVRFREVADAANRAGQADREKIARDRAALVEPKLSRLIVEVKSTAGVQVTKDGVPFGVAQWGAALPIDPGRHTIEATAPSKLAWKKMVEVPPDGKTMSVTVPSLESEPPRSEVPRVSTPQAGFAALGSPIPISETQAEPPGSSSPGRTIGWVVVGAGAIGVTIGTVFGLKVIAKNKDADDICPSGEHCLPSDKAPYDTAIAEAKSARIVSIAGFAAGGAALAAGTILILSSSKSTTTSVRVKPSLSATAATVSFQATW